MAYIQHTYVHSTKTLKTISASFKKKKKVKYSRWYVVKLGSLGYVAKYAFTV